MNDLRVAERRATICAEQRPWPQGSERTRTRDNDRDGSKYNLLRGA